MAEPLRDEDREILQDLLTLVTAIGLVKEDVCRVRRDLYASLEVLQHHGLLPPAALQALAGSMASHSPRPAMVVTESGVDAIPAAVVRETISEDFAALCERVAAALRRMAEDSP